MSRMDAGDLIGRQIVANLMSLVRRTPEESQLLFDAQRHRAALYQESSGATAVEAAEALVEARESLRETGARAEDLAALVKTGWSVLGDLVRIGSKRNAWSVVQILFEAIEVNPEYYGLKTKVLDVFVQLVRRHIEDNTEAGILSAILRLSEWAKKEAPERVAELVAFIPQVLALNLDEMRPEMVVSSFLYAKVARVGFDVPTLNRIVKRLVADHRIDTESRQVYSEFLATALQHRAKSEYSFENLAHVNPDPEVRFDPDLDSLNVLLSEYYGDSGWVWRNRALCLRKKGDPIGALACLAKAMTITGQPPELLGLLAPILHGIGFEYSAREFARFVPLEWHRRLHLHVLDELADLAGSEERRRDLLGRFERTLKQPDVPPEFIPSLKERRAEIYLDLGETKAAGEMWAEMRESDPANERAAIKLAEIWVRLGEVAKAEGALRGRFSASVTPLLEHLRSRIFEASEQWTRAYQSNEAARASLPAAMELARDKKMKFLAVLSERSRKLFGEDVADGPLDAMLQAEAYSVNQRDFELLGPILERRSVELSLRTGDSNTARRVIKDLVRSRPADTDIYVHGLRASLKTDCIEDAEEFLSSAKTSGHSDSAEVTLLTGLIAWKKKDKAAARAAFESALRTVPTAEARLALAVTALNQGQESEALDLLSGLRYEEGGTPEIRARLHDLRGRLLERAGKIDEALDCYLAAIGGKDDGSEARRRAGLIMIERALGPDGKARDTAATAKGLALLEGFNDPESVAHTALAKAGLESSRETAAAILATATKRLSAKHAVPIRLARLRALTAAGDHAAVRHEVQMLLDEGAEGDAENVKTTAKALLGSMLRREAWAVLDRESAHPSHALSQASDWLRRDRDAAGTSPAALILSAMADATVAVPVVDPATAPQLFVAAAWAKALRATALSSSESQALQAIAAGEAKGKESILASLLLTVLDETISASAVLAALDAAKAAGVCPPIGESSMIRIAAVRALRDGDDRTLDAAITRGGAPLADFAGYSRLARLIDGSQSVDAYRVLAVLRDLDETMRGRSGHDDLPMKRAMSLQSRLTAMREQPSPAWASAKLRYSGKRARTFVEDAARFWKEEVAAGRNVSVGRHVLALMELARAHDAESHEADSSAWKDAHVAWRALLDDGAFWKELARANERVFPGQGAAAVDQLRGSVPLMLLRAHLSFAKAKLHAGLLPLAIEHGKICVASPLVRDLDPRWREELYSALSADLERCVHTKRYEDALAILDHVIVVDPSNPHARHETARVAAAALGQALAIVDSLKSPPSPSMTSEICALIGRILAVAERPVVDLAKTVGAPGAPIAEIVTTLRAAAYSAHHRDRDDARAAERLELALELAKEHGLETAGLVRMRTEIGLAKVETTIAQSTTTHTGQESGHGDAFEHALEEVDRLLSFDPDNAKVITQKARLLMAKDRDGEAEQLARELFKKAQKRAEPAIVRAAVELLHQVQAGRERFRYESKMLMVDQLMRDKNWRDALSLLKDATHGREDELPHQDRAIEILLGLHRADSLKAAIDHFEKTGGDEIRVRWFRARLDCLEVVLKEGGDLLSAFELVERGDGRRAQKVGQELLNASPKRADIVHLIVAMAHELEGNAAGAAESARKAIAAAAQADRAQIEILAQSFAETKS